MFQWLFARLKSFFKINAPENIQKNAENEITTTLVKETNASMSLVSASNIRELPASIIDKHWAKVEKILYDRLVNLANSKLNDDKSLEFVFDKAYELMPMPIRLILPRHQFIQFCLNRKTFILRKIPTYNELKKQKANNPPHQAPTVATVNHAHAQNEFYESFLPELLALCITADGTPEMAEKELALAILENDDFINNKTQAFTHLEQNIENLSAKRLKSITLFKLQVANLIAKIPQITQAEQKERIQIIVDGMLATVHAQGLVETKDVTDRIKNKFNMN
jgi:hypothetical protein